MYVKTETFSSGHELEGTDGLHENIFFKYTFF